MNDSFVRVNEEQFARIESSSLFCDNDSCLDVDLDESKLYVTHNDQIFSIKQDFRARTFYISSNLINLLEDK